MTRPVNLRRRSPISRKLPPELSGAVPARSSKGSGSSGNSSKNKIRRSEKREKESRADYIANNYDRVAIRQTLRRLVDVVEAKNAEQILR